MVNSFSKISVVVPAFNRAHVLPGCLDSLVAQQYPKDCYEVLVVDNNSKDATRSVVEQYIRQYPEVTIRYLYEGKQGLVFARHTGAKNANFEILSFTDDDGILSANWLSEINTAFQIYSDVAAVGGKIIIRWDEAPPEWVIPYEYLLGKLDYGDIVRYEHGLYINGGNFSIKKDILFEVGGFNPDQIGEWLIGDGEVGLCRKLHQAGYLIGWSADALMEHFQVVKKNATLKDIKRRFINNGRGVPYSVYVVEKKGFAGLFRNLATASIEMAKWCVVYVLSVAKGNADRKLLSRFQLAFYLCQFPYTMHVLMNKRFRREITETEWI